MKSTTMMHETNQKINSILATPGERVFVGVDVHKQSYHVALWSAARQSLVTTWQQPSQPEALVNTLAPIKPQVARVAYEAGPTGYGLARRLQGEGLDVLVASPAHMPRPGAPDNKSDRLDCGRLAQLASQGLLRPVPVPTEQEEADRQLMRTRDQIMDNVKRAKIQIKSFLLVHGLSEPKGLAHWSQSAIAELRGLALRTELRLSLDLLLDTLAAATILLKRANQALRRLADAPRHAKNTRRLQTTPGVGLLTSLRVCTELVHPERFDNTRQVARYAGLAPRVRSSGQTRREHGLQPEGNPRLRTALIEAAWQWIRYDDNAKKRFHTLAARGGGPQSPRSAKRAIAAMARRLLITLWRMLTQKEDYDPARAA